MERNPSPTVSPPSPQGAEGPAVMDQPELVTPTNSSGSSPLPDYPPPFSTLAIAGDYTPFPTLTIANETHVQQHQQAIGSGAGPPKFDDLEPPPYNAVVKLPTYEEAQQEKMMGGDGPHHGNNGVGGVGSDPSRNGGNFSLMMTSFGAHHHHSSGESPYDTNTAELALGTDVYFFASFLIAFLFNWIGFLLLMCACHTVAGRYGALAGFGLSLAKWTLIVKHSTDLASNDNNWLWWLIMAFGVLICVRAVIQYLCIKREWHRLSRAAQERVVFFY